MFKKKERIKMIVKQRITQVLFNKIMVQMNNSRKRFKLRKKFLYQELLQDQHQYNLNLLFLINKHNQFSCKKCNGNNQL